MTTSEIAVHRAELALTTRRSCIAYTLYARGVCVRVCVPRMGINNFVICMPEKFYSARLRDAVGHGHNLSVF